MALGESARRLGVEQHLDLLEDGCSLRLTNGVAVRAVSFAQFGFDAIERGNELYDFLCDGVPIGFYELAASMRPAGGMGDQIFPASKPCRVLHQELEYRLT